MFAKLILAAAGLYAFDHNVQHLHEDHLNAHSIAERIAALPGITLDLGRGQTNVVVFSSMRGCQMPRWSSVEQERTVSWPVCLDLEL
jgi:threonine aldolase